jgi:hypothetical protein
VKRDRIDITESYLQGVMVQKAVLSVKEISSEVFHPALEPIYEEYA